MSSSIQTDPDFAALRDDLSALKADVAALVEHLKGGAKISVQNAADQVTDGARRLSQCSTAEADRTAKAIGLWVERQPLLAIAIALGVGYLGARVLSR